MPSYSSVSFGYRNRNNRNDNSSINETETDKYFELYEYLDLENLNSL